MAKRGRIPKPAELRLVEGNRGNRPIPEPVKPKATVNPPTPPSHLSAAAKTEWRRVARQLHKLGLLTSLDRAIFAAYCQAYGDWADAQKALENYRKTIINSGLPAGSVYLAKTSNGNMIQNPLVGVINTARRDMLRFAAELGLTPSARTQIASSDPKPPPKKDTSSGRFFAN